MNKGRPCAASTADNPAQRLMIALVSDMVGGVARAPALEKADSDLRRWMCASTLPIASWATDTALKGTCRPHMQLVLVSRADS